MAKSTHAGIPWLCYIRERLGKRVHFWPFDGWDIPAGPSAVVEVYHNFARLLLANGNAFSEAAVAAHQKTLGEGHAWSKDSARVTAEALDALGRADEAAALRPPWRQLKIASPGADIIRYAGAIERTKKPTG